MNQYCDHSCKEMCVFPVFREICLLDVINTLSIPSQVYLTFHDPCTYYEVKHIKRNSVYPLYRDKIEFDKTVYSIFRDK